MGIVAVCMFGEVKVVQNEWWGIRLMIIWKWMMVRNVGGWSKV